MALLDSDIGGYSREILLKAVLTVATGPVFERLLTLSPEPVIADLSSTELSTALQSKTRAEALQIYALWRAKWPDVAQATLSPFLPFIDPADIAGLAEHARSAAPQAYFDSLPLLLSFAPEDAVPQIIERAVEMLPEPADLHLMAPLVIAARGDVLRRVLHKYVRDLASLSRMHVMEEVSTVSGALAHAGPVGSADAIFDRVSTVLTYWQ
jgi:hypothetical protein